MAILHQGVTTAQVTTRLTERDNTRSRAFLAESAGQELNLPKTAIQVVKHYDGAIHEGSQTGLVSRARSSETPVAPSTQKRNNNGHYLSLRPQRCGFSLLFARPALGDTPMRMRTLAAAALLALTSLPAAAQDRTTYSEGSRPRVLINWRSFEANGFPAAWKAQLPM